MLLKGTSNWQNKNLPSAIRSILQSENLPVTKPLEA